MQSPCDCLYRSLSDEQKQQVDDTVVLKQRDFAAEYDDEKSTYLGAFAEVVFGFRYNLPINHTPGFDGGKDFSVPCGKTASGILTIDVKGTGYGLAATKNSESNNRWMLQDNFPYLKN